MLTSIADAHIEVVRTGEGVLEVDASASLQRVGVGKDVGSDTRARAMRQLGMGNRLRLELSAANDARDTNADATSVAARADEKVRERADAWKRALRHADGQPPLTLGEMCVLATLVQTGALDSLDEKQASDLLAKTQATVKADASDALQHIDQTLGIDDDELEALNAAVAKHLC